MNQLETTQKYTYLNDVKVFLNKETLTHKVNNELKVEMPINFYKKLLNIPFTSTLRNNADGELKITYGAKTKPSVFFTKDGQYLVHQVMGIRFSKHINYYKKIFGVEFISTVKAA